MQDNQKAVVLINIGSPVTYQVKDVKKYLKAFLMDKYVITLPLVFRWLLANLIIVPFRAEKSAKKYQTIWTDQGAPLTVESNKFANRLKSELGYDVYPAMCFSEPSIETVVKDIKQREIKQLLVVPMFPHYAESTSRSSMEAFEQIAGKYKLASEVKKMGAFYKSEEFINSWIQNIEKNLGAKTKAFEKVDYVLFSYHGLPVSHLKKDGKCIFEKDQCYRAQCMKTTEILGGLLGWDKSKYSTSFQSRLGRAEWIQPYTEATIIDLAKSGVKKLAVISPSFVVDGLETLEEINIELKEVFLHNGGENFTYVPSLNSEDIWVKSFAKLVKSNF